jgi:membrane protein YqaA with SNARE-associated domain
MLLRHGTKPATIFALALLACVDCFVPMLPTEVFVVALAILQPVRVMLIVMVFAASAGVSALLLSLVLSTFNEAAQWFGMQTLGTQWHQAMTALSAVGPGILVLAAVFPDSPRPSIAVLTFVGIEPIWIGLMVFTGKLMAGLNGVISGVQLFCTKAGSGPPEMAFLHK